MEEEIQSEGGSASSHIMDVSDKDSISACVDQIGEQYGQDVYKRQVVEAAAAIAILDMMGGRRA